ncbi:YbaB/EbfC family nucleoid-associated protein [Micromonospora sp. NPDC049559]|uniref:YbaB/EbfC family nucleoid-associated protein n=1 Tax=Micromonospora sp. NPDC049559 TaxID=3155923 RepID=UPI00343DDD15
MTKPVDSSGTGPAGIDSTGIERMLADATSALERFQASGADAEPVEGTGEAADGMIRVRAAAPGQLTSLTLDPRVLRLDSETLAEELLSAVNAALADLRSQAGGGGGLADFSGLNERLKEIQENASRQLNAFASALVDAQQRMAGQGGK